MKSGYTELCCFLCEWASRAKETLQNEGLAHAVKISSRENCVRNRPMFGKCKILLPLLHIELGLVKNFVKAVNKHDKGFEYLREQFPRLIDAKLTF